MKYAPRLQDKDSNARKCDTEAGIYKLVLEPKDFEVAIVLQDSGVWIRAFEILIHV